MDDIQHRARQWLSHQWNDTIDDTRYLIGAAKDVWSNGQIRAGIQEGALNLKQLSNIHDATSIAGTFLWFPSLLEAYH
jgi:hypothetical protein